MRFMMIVKGNGDSEAGVMPPPEDFQEMTKYNEQLVKAGILLAAEGLHPTSKGFKVSYDGPDKRTVVDGPFAEAKEVIAGYWLIETKTREEAIEWARRVPFQEGETRGAPDLRARKTSRRINIRKIMRKEAEFAGRNSRRGLIADEVHDDRPPEEAIPTICRAPCRQLRRP